MLRERERERERAGEEGRKIKAKMVRTREELGKTVDMSVFKQMHVRGRSLRPTDISCLSASGEREKERRRGSGRSSYLMKFSSMAPVRLASAAGASIVTDGHNHSPQTTAHWDGQTETKYPTLLLSSFLPFPTLKSLTVPFHMVLLRSYKTRNTVCNWRHSQS